MNNLKITLTLLSAILFGCAQPSAEPEKITSAIETFVKAGDEQNIGTLSEILHPEFRAVANRLFGSDEVQTLNKQVYMDLIQKGTIGGDLRKVEILDLQQDHHNAQAKVRMTGNDFVFTTFILLVQLPNDSWKILSDLAHLEKVE